MDQERLTVSLTVDAIIFDISGRILLIKRKNNPYQDHWALPGGFVDVGETVEQAVIRELKEETTLWLKGATLQLSGVYSAPNRDPRGRTVSVAFAGIVEHTGHLKAQDDAKQVAWIKNWEKFPLAFDHRQIIKEAWEKLGLKKELLGSYQEPDNSTLNPKPIQLTQSQRRALLNLYNGASGLTWDDIYIGLIKRGLIAAGPNNLGQVLYTITKKGQEAISK